MMVRQKMDLHSFFYGKRDKDGLKKIYYNDRKKRTFQTHAIEKNIRDEDIIGYQVSLLRHTYYVQV